MTALVEELVLDDRWAVVEPLLPPPPRPWWGGRVRTIPARICGGAAGAPADRAAGSAAGESSG